jgi:predicted 3'-5' exonuclease similar to PolB exonuclease domain
MRLLVKRTLAQNILANLMWRRLLQATVQKIQRNVLIEQANWCFRAMRDCTEPQLTAELAHLGSTLLNKARKESQLKGIERKRLAYRPVTRNRRLATKLLNRADAVKMPSASGRSDFDKYHRERKISEIAEHSQNDVINTYRLWLRYRLFPATLNRTGSKRARRDVIRQERSKGHL